MLKAIKKLFNRKNNLIQFGIVEKSNCDICNNTQFYQKAKENVGEKDVNGLIQGYMLNVCEEHSTSF